jgi:hypothetical protein
MTSVVTGNFSANAGYQGAFRDGAKWSPADARNP